MKGLLICLMSVALIGMSCKPAEPQLDKTFSFSKIKDNKVTVYKDSKEFGEIILVGNIPKFIGPYNTYPFADFYKGYEDKLMTNWDYVNGVGPICCLDGTDVHWATPAPYDNKHIVWYKERWQVNLGEQNPEDEKAIYDVDLKTWFKPLCE